MQINQSTLLVINILKFPIHIVNSINAFNLIKINIFHPFAALSFHNSQFSHIRNACEMRFMFSITSVCARARVNRRIDITSIPEKLFPFVGANYGSQVFAVHSIKRTLEMAVSSDSMAVIEKLKTLLDDGNTIHAIHSIYMMMIHPKMSSPKLRLPFCLLHYVLIFAAALLFALLFAAAPLFAAVSSELRRTGEIDVFCLLLTRTREPETHHRRHHHHHHRHGTRVNGSIKLSFYAIKINCRLAPATKSLNG